MPLDLMFNAALGLAFALCARDRIRVDGLFSAPAFTLVLLFTGMILIPVTLYLYVVHSAWMWMYLVDPAAVPGVALVPLLVCHGGVVIVGWIVGGRLLCAGKGKAVVYSAGALALLTLVGVVVFWGRLAHVGSYEEFMDSRAVAIMEVKLGYVMVALVLGSSAAAGFTAFELTRDSRRVRAR